MGLVVSGLGWGRCGGCEFICRVCHWLTALHWGRGSEAIVDALVEKLSARLGEWKPETAAEVRERVAEVIELADHGILDIGRSRAAEQEVLDLLDEPPAR